MTLDFDRYKYLYENDKRVKNRESRHGFYGELVAYAIFDQLLNSKVNLSESHYDSVKDMVAIINDKECTVEVKTSTPYVTQNAFTFQEDQLTKCQSVDMLVLVNSPISEKKLREFKRPNWEHNGSVFISRRPSLLSFEKYKKKYPDLGWRNMVKCSFDDSNLYKIYTLDKEKDAFIWNKLVESSTWRPVKC